VNRATVPGCSLFRQPDDVTWHDQARQHEALFHFITEPDCPVCHGLAFFLPARLPIADVRIKNAKTVTKSQSRTFPLVSKTSAVTTPARYHDRIIVYISLILHTTITP
jgi:hypothetical protein